MRICKNKPSNINSQIIFVTPLKKKVPSFLQNKTGSCYQNNSVKKKNKNSSKNINLFTEQPVNFTI